MEEDIRWRQRYEHLRKAVSNLEGACKRAELNDLERQGLIKGFEMAYELAWKTLQDILREAGQDALGPKPVLRQAFLDGLISDGEAWAAMHQARNLAAHCYDEAQARQMEADIRSAFLPAFLDLVSRLGGEM